MPQPRKQYDKKQVLIPLYASCEGISTGKFAEILDCNPGTARRILVEMKQEGLVTETGIQTISYNASAKQNIKHNQAGLRNNLNPWRITEAGKKYVWNTVVEPLIADEDVSVWIFAVVYGKACELNATKCDLLTKLCIQIKSESDFELTEFGVEIYYDYVRDDVVSFEGFDNILTPLAKAESVTTKKLKQICQNDYKLRVLKTLEFIEEIKKGHWALTEDALEDMEVFLHNTEAYEEDNDRHECYLLVRDRLAALKLSEPVDNEDEEPLYSEVTLEIMSYLSGSCSYTVAELVKFIGFSSKIIEAELLDMDSKNAAFQQDNGEWCLTAEAEDYWDEILREKLIDKLTDADFDWLVDLYKNRETTSGCEHTKEMELLGWITKNESGGWKITPDGCEHAIIELELDLENVDEIKEQEEPLLITEQLLTFDEIDEKPVLRFAIPIRNETVNGWIEIETINDEHYKDVILAIHANTTAALDLTEFFDSAILDGISKYPDGTRRFECNRKVAYAFFKMIMEKPVLQCGIDESEESPVEFGKKEEALLLTALMGVLNTKRLVGFCGSDAEFEKLKSRGYIEPEPQDCWGVSKSGLEHLIKSMKNGNVKSEITDIELKGEYLSVVELYEELNATPKPLTHTLTEIDKAILKSIKIGERSLDSIQCNWDVNRLEGLNRLDIKKKGAYIKARLSQLKADGLIFGNSNYRLTDFGNQFKVL